ncbi:MAG: hypothetical protein ACE5IO_00840 [Thermoplasmata archaeon]
MKASGNRVVHVASAEVIPVAGTLPVHGTISSQVSSGIFIGPPYHTCGSNPQRRLSTTALVLSAGDSNLATTNLLMNSSTTNLGKMLVCQEEMRDPKAYVAWGFGVKDRLSEKIERNSEEYEDDSCM